MIIVMNSLVAGSPYLSPYYWQLTNAPNTSYQFTPSQAPMPSFNSCSSNAYAERLSGVMPGVCQSSSTNLNPQGIEASGAVLVAPPQRLHMDTGMPSSIDVVMSAASGPSKFSTVSLSGIGAGAGVGGPLPQLSAPMSTIALAGHALPSGLLVTGIGSSSAASAGAFSDAISVAGEMGFHAQLQSSVSVPASASASGATGFRCIGQPLPQLPNTIDSESASVAKRTRNEYFRPLLPQQMQHQTPDSFVLSNYKSATELPSDAYYPTGSNFGPVVPLPTIVPAMAQVNTFAPNLNFSFNVAGPAAPIMSNPQSRNNVSQHSTNIMQQTGEYTSSKSCTALLVGPNSNRFTSEKEEAQNFHRMKRESTVTSEGRLQKEKTGDKAANDIQPIRAIQLESSSGGFISPAARMLLQ